MRIVSFAELDSTSTQAATLLAAGTEVPPFAVMAATQTAGRGRRGNPWESPVGNLYVTFALPPLRATHDAAPLVAAVIVAREIARLTGLTPTLKWPNDLLFAGKKIGGLLLEGSMRGDEPGAVLCGLGLNLSSAPELAPPLEAGSLAALSGRTLAPRAVAEALAAAFEREWGSEALSGAALHAAWSELAIAPGQLWIAQEDGAVASTRAGAGLALDGALVLRALDSDATETLHSADHRFRWLYQGHGRDAAPLVLADVGNTRTKLAAHLPASAATAERFADEDPALAALAATLPSRPWPIFALSVNPARLADFTRRAAAHGLTVVPLTKRNVLRRDPIEDIAAAELEVYPLAELGIDRLAACEGWLSTLSPAERAASGKTAILVSCGTALTVDAVDANGTHYGGLIAPGLQTALSSLHAATGLLPLLDAQSAPSYATLALGRSTRDAMFQGALHAAAGAVVAVASRHVSPIVLLTGGDAERLIPLLPRSLGARLAPDLVLTGAKSLALGGIAP